MLEIGIVRIERLLYLLIDQAGLTCLPTFLLPLRDLSDAFVDYGRGCRPHFHSLVLESFEDKPIVRFLPEKLVERDDRLFLAELPQNEHG